MLALCLLPLVMTKLTRKEWAGADNHWLLLSGSDKPPLRGELGVKAPIVRKVSHREYPSEWTEQCAVINWWGQQCRAWGYDYRHLLAVPNSGNISTGADFQDRKRAEIRMARLKAAGLRPGAPDLILAIPRQPDCALWIEMKALDGRVSPEQDDYHALLRGSYRVAVCKGAGAAIETIKDYLGRR